MAKKCLTCKTDITGSHSNRKRCEDCAAKSRQKPLGTMTKAQIKIVRSLADKKKLDDIAKELVVSRSNLIRSVKPFNISFTYHNKHKNNPEMVKKIFCYYEKHGKVKTQEKFPDIKVRSVIERYKLFSPRQIRWTDKEYIEAVKMAGLVSFKSQWIYFKRPLAYEGSIKSFWMKKFGFGSGKVNGLATHRGKNFVSDKCKPIKTMSGYTRNKKEFSKSVYLWVDIEKHLNPSTNKDFKKAIKSLAKFQRWLWQSENPKPKILKMIKERELINP